MGATQAQKAAAGNSKGNTLVMAGPGTGKTSTLIERLHVLIRNKVPLDAIFVTTFTAKAATEIRERLRATLGVSDGMDVAEILKGAHIGTFHSLCARLLKRYPTEVGLPYNFTIISDDAQRQMLYELGIEWDEEEGNYVDLISRWKDKGFSVAQAMEDARKIGDKFTIGAAKAYEAYEEKRQADQSVDFSDLISLATKLLQGDGPGAKWFRGNFTHFIVDEYQDVNEQQVQFLLAAMSKYSSIWAVGDDDQSIYEWRGSSPKYCLDFQKMFKPAKVFRLTESFRCSPLIVDMSSKLISRNVGRHDKDMKPARKAVKGEFVLFKGFADAEAEAGWVANQLRKHADAGGLLRNAALLYRTSSVGTIVQRHLERLGVPFRLVGSGSFWDLTEVRLFVVAVAAISGDRRFDTKTGFGRTKVGFKCRSLAEELKGENVRAFAQPLARVLWEYRPRNLDPERKGAWMSSVEAVLNLLLEMDDTTKFLNHAYEKKAREENEQGDVVTLTTLHSAKGLEWDMCFLMGAEDEMLPHFKSQNLEEERRLMYVGMTRARHQLIVSYARRRHDKAQIPSRFLREAVLPEEHRTGVFRWSDADPGAGEEKPAPKAEAAPTATVTASGRRKSFRHKGGRSLIPPEERGK
jgi:DNA helicase II / ATP-dependent DNA helicase PcrA